MGILSPSRLLTLLKRPTPTTFQVLSDLHLELGQQYTTYTFPATAPYLLLAGDTGRLVDYAPLLAFLTAQTTRFKHVFLVLGNHEFYGLSHAATLAAAQRLAADPRLERRLTVLHRARVDVPDSAVSILGCSLWSHIPPAAQPAVAAGVNDFARIQDWTPAAHNAEHARDLAWLRDQVRAIRGQDAGLGAEKRARKVLVVTHHAPCVDGTSEPRWRGSGVGSAFASDVLGGDRGEWEGVGVWLFGHTHFSTDFVRAGVRVVSNQRGYVLPGAAAMGKGERREGAGRAFDEGFVVRL